MVTIRARPKLTSKHLANKHFVDRIYMCIYMVTSDSWNLSFEMHFCTEDCIKKKKKKTKLNQETQSLGCMVARQKGRPTGLLEPRPAKQDAWRHPAGAHRDSPPLPGLPSEPPDWKAQGYGAHPHLPMQESKVHPSCVLSVNPSGTFLFSGQGVH
jgi:hypothetical protein